jgi:hypothetical protein
MDMAHLQLLKSNNVLEKQGGKLCSITDFIPLQTVTDWFHTASGFENTHTFPNVQLQGMAITSRS